MKALIFRLLAVYRRVALLLIRASGRTPAEHHESRIVSGRSWDEFCDALKAAGSAISMSGTPKDAMKMGRVLSETKDVALANLKDAIAYLKSADGVSRIGVMGWCQGGRWSMLTALNYPADIDATVVYYGRVTDDKSELEVLDMPVLGIFAGDDFIVPPKLVYRFAAAMEDLDKDLEFYMYRDAAHAFSNPSGEDYNPEAAADAWQRTTAFLARNLQEE